MQRDHVLKKLNFELLTPLPKSTKGVGPRTESKITFDMFHNYCTSACKISVKNIDNRVIVRFKYLTFDLTPP